MDTILAVDAGGTTTRAVLVDGSGGVLGYGLAGSGNPVSAGVDAALDALGTAARRALESCAQPQSPTAALIVMAGASAPMPRERIPQTMAALGVRGAVHVESDLLGAFSSGTTSDQGYALVAGTGAVAARIRQGHIEVVADGTGWLLGDAGSGYWVGHRVVTAVVADLDGRGRRTALTEALLGEVGLSRSRTRVDGRPAELLQLMHELYALRPVQLSRFAPLAFALSDDEAAGRILDEAAAELVNTLGSVRESGLLGPVVLGGGLLSRTDAGSPDGSTHLGRAIAETLDGVDVVPVSSGVLGAAVLGLRRHGVSVDSSLFERMRHELGPWVATARG